MSDPGGKGAGSTGGMPGDRRRALSGSETGLRGRGALLPVILSLAACLPPVLCGDSFGASDSLPAFKVARDRRYDAIFRRESGWVGGDAVDSIPLGNNRVLWLFGDTLLGRIQGGRRVIGTMVRNSMAIQNGLDPKSAAVTFLHGSVDGRPEAFFRPESGTGWFWPGRGGIRTREGLYIFLTRIVKADAQHDLWGFRTAGMVLAKITNPDDTPDRWIIRQYKVPFYLRDQSGNERSFGVPQGRKGDWIYLSGFDEDERNGNRYLLAARTASERLEDFSAWRFRADGYWTKEFGRAARLCDHVGAELSVSELKGLHRHLLVTTENGLSDRIVLRTSPTPWGPWSPAETLHHAQEPRRDRSLLCYAAKAHPELARDDNELIVSYICNTTDPDKLTKNPHLYLPEFLRVRFQQDPSPSGRPLR